MSRERVLRARGDLATIGGWFLAGVVGLEVCIALGYYALATLLPQISREFDADSAYSLSPRPHR